MKKTNSILNKNIIIGVTLVIVVILLTLSFFIKNKNTYAVDEEEDFIVLNCNNSEDKTIECSIDVNIVTSNVLGMETKLIATEDLEFVNFVPSGEYSKLNSSISSDNKKIIIVSSSIIPEGNTKISDLEEIKGKYTIGKLIYKLPENIDNSKDYSITLSDSKMTYIEENTERTIGIKSSTYIINSNIPKLDNITLNVGSLDEDFNPDIFEYSAIIENDKVNIEIEKRDDNLNVTGIGEQHLNYGSNLINIKVTNEIGTETIYKINLFRTYTFTNNNIDKDYKYFIDGENKYLYTKYDVDESKILSKINLPEGLIGSIKNNILTIKTSNNEIMTTMNIINITSSKYEIKNNNIYITDENNIDLIILNGVNIKIFDEGEEINEGILKENQILRVYYNDKLLDEYEIKNDKTNDEIYNNNKTGSSILLIVFIGIISFIILIYLNKKRIDTN